MIKSERGIISPEQIIQTQAKFLGGNPEVVYSRSRKRKDMELRRDVELEMHQNGMNVREIGEALGGRDFSGVARQIRKALAVRESGYKEVTQEITDAASDFLQSNFAERTIDRLTDYPSSKTDLLPQKSLVRYLFYNLGQHALAISGMLNISEIRTRRIITETEEKFVTESEAWKKAEEIKLKLQKTKEVREKEKQERIEQERRSTLLVKYTIQLVAQAYFVDPEEMVSKSRKKIFVQPRNTAQFIMFENSNMGYRKISLAVGRTDHATAMHSIGKVRERLEIDPEFRERVEEMFATINRLTDEAMQAEKNPEQNVVYLINVSKNT